MDDGSGERDYRRKALVGLRPDPEHRGCDIFTRRVRDIYNRRLHFIGQHCTQHGQPDARLADLLGTGEDSGTNSQEIVGDKVRCPGPGN